MRRNNILFVICFVLLLLKYSKAGAQQDISPTSDNVVSMTMFMDADLPWYRSVWFCVTLVVIVAVLIVLVVSLRNKCVKLNHELKDISRTKELSDSNVELFSNISNEIRTPMTLIMSPLNKLMDADDDPERQRNYKTISINAQRILGLVNKALEANSNAPVQMSADNMDNALIALENTDTTCEPDQKDGEPKSRFRKIAKVVVVAGDEQLRKYVVQMLESYFHVKDFADGSAALLYIIKSRPDAVISDLMAEQMDGMTLCKKIRRNVDTNTIPVILLASDTHDCSRIKALDIGADAYITKPFNISVLSHTITNLLKRNLTLKNSFLGRQANPQDDAKEESVEESPDQKLMSRVLKVINENMSNPSLTVEEIAKAVGISRVHLHRKLKGLTNQSTVDFLRNVRLDRALKLLRVKHSSIYEVAQEVGFVSTAYFSTAFKERFGCPPSVYVSDNNAVSEPILKDDYGVDNNSLK